MARRQENPNRATGANGLARSRSHIGALPSPWTEPDLHHLAGWRIEETFAAEAPVWSRRCVERAPLVAALAEEEPDQEEREKEAERKQERDHGTSMTAAVP